MASISITILCLLFLSVLAAEQCHESTSPDRTSLLQSQVKVLHEIEDNQELMERQNATSQESDDNDELTEHESETRELLSKRVDKDIEDGVDVKKLIKLGKDVDKLTKKYSAFFNKVPNDFKLSSLVKAAAGGVESINTKFVEPALDRVEGAIKTASSNLPDFALPLLGCVVEGRQHSDGNPASGGQQGSNSLVAVSSAEDASWIDSTLTKIEDILDDLSNMQGMEVLKAGEDVVKDAFRVVKTKVVPFVEKLLAFVREKVVEVLNTILGLILPDPPSLLEKDVEHSPAGIFAWLGEETPIAARSSANTVIEEAMAETWKQFTNVTKCGGGSKPKSLTNPPSLETLWPTAITRTMNVLRQSLTDLVADEMQPHVLKFLTGMATISDNLASAIVAAVSEVPVVGPLIGVVVKFIIQTFNKLLWIPFATPLIDCSFRMLMTSINDDVSSALESVIQRASDSSGASKMMSPSDLPRKIRNSPIAKVIKWTYNLAIPNIMARIDDANQQRATIAAATNGFQCSQ
jgi:hypothetical protein